jgi:hypothetical protein
MFYYFLNRYFIIHDSVKTLKAVIQ